MLPKMRISLDLLGLAQLKAHVGLNYLNPCEYVSIIFQEHLLKYEVQDVKMSNLHWDFTN